MKSVMLIALMLGASPASVVDAPVVLDQSKLRDVRIVHKGDVVPDDGLWMDKAAALDSAAELQVLREEHATRPTTGDMVTAVIIGLVVGAGAGVGLTLAFKR